MASKRLKATQDKLDRRRKVVQSLSKCGVCPQSAEAVLKKIGEIDFFAMAEQCFQLPDCTDLTKKFEVDREANGKLAPLKRIDHIDFAFKWFQEHLKGPDAVAKAKSRHYSVMAVKCAIGERSLYAIFILQVDFKAIVKSTTPSIRSRPDSDEFTYVIKIIKEKNFISDIVAQILQIPKQTLPQIVVQYLY